MAIGEQSNSGTGDAQEAAGFWDNPYLRSNENGKILPPEINALAWWFSHPDMNLSRVRYNTLTGRIDAELLPWNPEPHDWRDTDTSFLLAEIQSRSNGLAKSERDVLHALNILADKQKYDPLIEMLEGLPEWDGKNRADTLIVDFLGAEDTAYTRAATRHLLRGAVMRAYHPGCKFDEAIMLSSTQQGIGKSTLLRKLAMNDEFFTDNIGQIATREGSEVLQGCWIVEIGELEGIREKAITIVKQYISRQGDRYREAYARYPETRRRRCVFVGTTNSSAFLFDRTGNRRFLPIRCNAIKPTLDIFSSDVDKYIEQVWAEIIADYRISGGFDLKLPEEVLEDAEAQREDFSVDDAKSGLIDAWASKECEPGDRVCIVQILEEVFDIPRKDANRPCNKALQNELTQVLDSMPNMSRVMSSKKPKHSEKYGQQRCWEYRPDEIKNMPPTAHC